MKIVLIAVDACLLSTVRQDVVITAAGTYPWSMPALTDCIKGTMQFMRIHNDFKTVEQDYNAVYICAGDKVRVYVCMCGVYYHIYSLWLGIFDFRNFATAKRDFNGINGNF